MKNLHGLTAADIHAAAVEVTAKMVKRDAVPVAVDAVGKVAIRVCDRLSGEYPGLYVSHYEVADDVIKSLR